MHRAAFVQKLRAVGGIGELRIQFLRLRGRIAAASERADTVAGRQFANFVAESVGFGGRHVVLRAALPCRGSDIRELPFGVHVVNRRVGITRGWARRHFVGREYRRRVGGEIFLTPFGRLLRVQIGQTATRHWNPVGDRRPRNRFARNQRGAFNREETDGRGLTSQVAVLHGPGLHARGRQGEQLVFGAICVGLFEVGGNPWVPGGGQAPDGVVAVLGDIGCSAESSGRIGDLREAISGAGGG